MEFYLDKMKKEEPAAAEDAAVDAPASDTDGEEGTESSEVCDAQQEPVNVIDETQ
jgi:hypothetical protein